jgi:uncharacterized protein YuzE
MMQWDAQVEYDAEADAAYVRLGHGQAARTVDLESSALGMPVLVDLDESGRILGFEILDAQRQLGPAT